MTERPTRWRLERDREGFVRLHVELVEDAPARGYTIYVLTRAHAREELRNLRRLVQAIGDVRHNRVYDPVEACEHAGR